MQCMTGQAVCTLEGGKPVRCGLGVCGKRGGEGFVTDNVVQLVDLQGQSSCVCRMVVGSACRAVPAAATWRVSSCSDGEVTLLQWWLSHMC
jgi:hypothetical protein